MAFRVTESIFVSCWGMLVGFACTKALFYRMGLSDFITLRVCHTVYQILFCFMGWVAVSSEYRQADDYFAIGWLGCTISSGLSVFIHWYGTMDIVKWDNYCLVSWILGGGPVERGLNVLTSALLFSYYGWFLIIEPTYKQSGEVIAVLIIAFMIGYCLECYFQF